MCVYMCVKTSEESIRMRDMLVDIDIHVHCCFLLQELLYWPKIKLAFVQLFAAFAWRMVTFMHVCNALVTSDFINASSILMPASF